MASLTNQKPEAGWSGSLQPAFCVLR